MGHTDLSPRTHYHRHLKVEGQVYNSSRKLISQLRSVICQCCPPPDTGERALP